MDHLSSIIFPKFLISLKNNLSSVKNVSDSSILLCLINFPLAESVRCFKKRFVITTVYVYDVYENTMG